VRHDRGAHHGRRRRLHEGGGGGGGSTRAATAARACREGWHARGGTGAAAVGSGRGGDEGMTNRPSIFAYLVFGPGEITVEVVARPIRTAAGRGSGATLGVQARIRRVQVGLIFG
jgi:hypothetical protein